MKSENFIVIQGWMCNELGLKGNELLIFALIYGFSQDGDTRFYGSRSYMANAFNISLPTVDKAIDSLEEKNLIEVTVVSDAKTGIHNEYNINKPQIDYLMGVVKKLYGGSKETLLGGSKETLHNNNKQNNKSISKDIKKEEFKFGAKETSVSKSKKPSLWDKCINEIHSYTDDEELTDLLVKALKQFLENSKEAGTPFYLNHFKGKLNKLDTIADTMSDTKAVVQQTLDNGWNNFYELKSNKRYGKTGNAAQDIEHLTGGLNQKAKKGVIKSEQKF